jgi:hypothetical protein
VVLDVWGLPEPEVEAAARGMGLGSAVRFHPPVPHAEAMGELAHCDCVLVAVAPTHAHLVPQKLYNYLALERWVLAVAPADSMVARVVRKTGAGSVTEPEPAAVERSLAEAVERVDRGVERPAPDPGALAAYARSAHARRLSDLFEEAIAHD